MTFDNLRVKRTKLLKVNNSHDNSNNNTCTSATIPQALPAYLRKIKSAADT